MLPIAVWHDRANGTDHEGTEQVICAFDGNMLSVGEDAGVQLPHLFA